MLLYIMPIMRVIWGVEISNSLNKNIPVSLGIFIIIFLLLLPF